MDRLMIAAREILKDSLETYGFLLKVMVPVMIAVRLAAEFGAVELLAQSFAPVMELVGLPGETGIVWVAAMLINIYAGAVALIGLMDGMALTTAQLTVLLTMLLIAHSLPVEQRVAQLAGPSLVFTTTLRIVAAVVLGWIMQTTYTLTGTLQDPAVIAWLPKSPEPGWWPWVIDSLKTLAGIYVILLALLALLRLMKAIGITDYLVKITAPGLKRIGIGADAAPMTMVGLLLGLSYGGAIILLEARRGTMSRKDIFLALCLLCLCHSVIEDSLLMMALGADWTGVFLFRIVFSLIAIAALAWLIDRLPVGVFERFLCAELRTEKTGQAS